MDNIKHKAAITTVLLTIFALLSCNDYLEENMISDVSSDSYYSTKEGLEDAMNAAYSYLKVQYFGQESGMSMTVYGTDLHSNGSDGNKKLGQYNFDPSLDELWEVWSTMYQGINQCNAIIERTDKNEEVNEDFKIELTAEARFLRAMYYFILVRQFGDVHLTLSETIGIETEANKTSRNEIYQTAIIPDLEYGIANLPDKQVDYGRATKAAAQFLLSKVYLTYGWLENDKEIFKKSIRLAEDIIKNENYSLLSDYADLWKIDNQKNSEVIWGIQNSTDPLTRGNGNRSHLFFLMGYDKLPGMKRSIDYGRPYIRYSPTPYALSLWNREYDSRYYKSYQHVWFANNTGNLLPAQKVGDTAIFLPGVNIGQKYYISGENGSRVEKILTQNYVDAHHNQTHVIYTPEERNGEAGTGYTERVYASLGKFIDPTRESTNLKEGTRDFFVMRLAEAYLIAAEAYIKIDDKVNAAKMLNVVRRRAAWPGFESQMKITESEVRLDLILEERGRELLGEMQRWYDLSRMGVLLDRVKMYSNATNSPNYAKNNITEKHTLRPIPQNQIDRTSNAYNQNPGW
ncbi:RagB/SusD family nutrient uptake outer membrane protein [Arenibacter sp. M-2]|uniref:RagB/SusD family nutrient uptake outer membrane protein n=1 Tax=Arenibacter sp. M-2 TaxID=3053612 RepID=UPI0025700E9B|nr:RagB/SusD family nutrient uptake outer membrane protein [Arenibacter sp. M-2]MDL5512916.1 RagB/SusD family nutrient uptake outer membrane protein [Arenibacter sp. M-2]